ncbi:MAG: hypothetical protein L0G99_12045, partial [Propionibacteriales bacterium]|nr:hypothetical protein [Propionibacteriales bacterium]
QSGPQQSGPQQSGLHPGAVEQTPATTDWPSSLQAEAQEAIARDTAAMLRAAESLDSAVGVGEMNGVTVEVDGNGILQSVNITHASLDRDMTAIAGDLVAAHQAAKDHITAMINSLTGVTR